MNIPFHPMLVHFPIALYFLEFLLLGFWIFKKDSFFGRAALFTFRVAFLSMLAAVVTGWLDSGGWQNIKEGGDLGEHFFGAVAVAVIQTFRGIYWQVGKPQDEKGARLCFVTALIGFAAVIYTAYHGGEMVYHSE